MYYNIYASKRQKPQLCGTASNNVASLMYASNSQKFILCGNALGDDSTLIHSSPWQQCKFRGSALGDDVPLIHSLAWQQCKFRGNASNNVASLMYASKRQKPTAQGNTLGKHPQTGLRPVRAKVLHIKALRMLLSLQDVPTPSNITWGVTPGCMLLPLRGAHHMEH